MKQNYNPKHLTKHQRHMKKWIPDGTYCEGGGVGKYKNPCPFWHRINNSLHKREKCKFSNICSDDCSKCNEQISCCSFLKYTEYGQYPLGDMCKICGIRNEYQ